MKVMVELDITNRVYDENCEAHDGGRIHTLRFPAELTTDDGSLETVDGIVQAHQFVGIRIDTDVNKSRDYFI